MSLKKNIDWKLGNDVARDFIERTRVLYKRVEIAGSLRRMERIVHDIDLAVIPMDQSYSFWTSRLRERISEIGGTAIMLGEVICNIKYRDVQINLFVCTNEQYWGVLFMWATGPKGHTIGMNIKAGKKGYHMSSKGLFTNGEDPKLIATPTEEEVARILEWKYKPPESRGKNRKDDNPY